MISVILPVFNCKNYIERCLDSILNQSYSNLEIIIVDDGSTDGTSLICDKYAAIDKRIKVIHQLNKGVSESRNLGLQLSKGEYISFVDNDDWLSPFYFQCLYESIIKDDYPLSMVLYKKTDHYYSPKTLCKYTTKEISGEEMRQKLFEIEKYDEPFGFIWAKLYKREILQDLKFKTIIGEDIDFSFQVSYRINKAIVINEFLYFWFQHSASQFRNIKPENMFLSVKCYYTIFNNIPKKETKTIGQCLIRLYKIILNVRYNTKFYVIPQNNINTNYNFAKIITETRKEFIANKSIPFFLKSLLLIFYYQPSMYNLFRKIIPLFKK